MQLKISGTRATLELETKDEIKKVLEFYSRFFETKEETTNKKPRKKHVHTKTCDECGKGFKGLHGLMIHKAGMHGYKSPNHDYNKQHREKTRSKDDLAQSLASSFL